MTARGQTELAATSERDDDEAITRALSILTSRLHHRPAFADCATVRNYLRLQSQGLPHEVFAVMFLDAQSRLIAYEPMFRGTLAESTVYPREVVRRALAHNASCVILHHNHPSGTCEPSAPDRALTLQLASVLGLVDVRVLDHVITSDSGAFSMAAAGLLQAPPHSDAFS